MKNQLSRADYNSQFEKAIMDDNLAIAKKFLDEEVKLQYSKKLSSAIEKGAVKVLEYLLKQGEQTQIIMNGTNLLLYSKSS